MTTSDLGEHLLDTGPMLCLGYSHATGTEFVLADFYDQEFLTQAHIVEAVAGELVRQANDVLRPGAPKMKGARKKAARSAGYHYKHLLASAIARPSPVPDDLAQVEKALADSAAQKSPGHTPHPDEHRGEAESIHWAALRTARFVACDGDAHRVAAAKSVPSVTFVEVMRRVARRRKDVDRNTLFRALQNTAVAGIDVGERLTSPLDLA